MIGPVLKNPPPSLSLSDTPVDRVTVFKLLGVHVASDLKWSQHVDAITSKADARLHFLKQLKRLGAGQDDLLCFYGTVIRPVLEYACPVRHSSLTAMQTKALEESLQCRVLHIIYEDSNYTMSCQVRYAGVKARTTDRALLQAQCPSRNIVPALLAPRQA